MLLEGISKSKMCSNAQFSNVPCLHIVIVVHDGTDEQGWQYRTSWPTQAEAALDENWSKKNAGDADVRRRLWMTTLVERESVFTAKMKLSEVVVSREVGLILNGPLLRLEGGETGGKEWIPRNCTLTNEKVIITDEETGEMVDEVHVVGCRMKMLDGFAFSIRTLNGSNCVLFDSDSEETRRKWLSAIRYQIAVRSPLIDFASFPNSPTLWPDETHRIVLSGYLLKKGQMGIKWNRRYFRLTPKELQHYDEDVLKGSSKVCVIGTS